MNPSFESVAVQPFEMFAAEVAVCAAGAGHDLDHRADDRLSDQPSTVLVRAPVVWFRSAPTRSLNAQVDRCVVENTGFSLAVPRPRHGGSLGKSSR